MEIYDISFICDFISSKNKFPDFSLIFVDNVQIPWFDPVENLLTIFSDFSLTKHVWSSINVSTLHFSALHSHNFSLVH